jgi:hypothetical protein
VADLDYTEVVMISRGSPSVREIPGWDEMLAAKHDQGWVLDSVTADHEQAVVRFRPSTVS